MCFLSFADSFSSPTQELLTSVPIKGLLVDVTSIYILVKTITMKLSLMFFTQICLLQLKYNSIVQLGLKPTESKVWFLTDFVFSEIISTIKTSMKLTGKMRY